MKRVCVYLKLRVIGAIDGMVGTTIVSRIKEVSKLTFYDEEGVPVSLPGVQFRPGSRSTSRAA